MGEGRNLNTQEEIASHNKSKKGKVIVALLVLVVLVVIGVCAFKVYKWLDTAYISGIVLKPVEETTLERGSTLQLEYEVQVDKNCIKYPKISKYFDEPSIEDVKALVETSGGIKWESSTDAVSIDTPDTTDTTDTTDTLGSIGTGLITAVNKGDTTVTVKIGETEFKDMVDIKVKVTPLGITSTEEIKFKKYKEQQQIEYAVNPEDADITKFVFESTDTSVATVDENGLVTAIKAGTATIITKLEGYDFVAETKVVVPEPAPVYPMSYSDDGVTINIYKEKYAGSWVYAAHVQMSDYSRLGTACANGRYGGGRETTSHAASRLGAILTINGDWAAPNLNYPVVRSGQLCNSKGALWCPAVYSRNTGMLLSAWETGGTPGYAGADLGSLVSSGAVTDTFSFGPPMLANGAVIAGSAGGRAQRTFIGTSGAAGDIWLVVSDGRKNDGVSSGLTYGECAQYLQSKGCTFGVPLDGGGSTTMVFKGKVLNAAHKQRSVVDFVYVR